jgi:hypothetical protein
MVFKLVHKIKVVKEGEPMKENIALITREFTLMGFSRPLMVCKAKGGGVLSLTQGQETFLRGYDGDVDLFVRVVEMMNGGRLAVLEILNGGWHNDGRG